ncbi:carbon monoxide dehydrogenase subunit G [Streptomyces canus]|uniref:SRPBCC domain-containing protein n=1 Tax=Streptomyces canus TaxID=58343 RepID=UPI00277F5604|nr:SRPBCC domain-containing protein [Streptomyces canus]MDQ0600205.1 carbon monoxide dehydrogenase subunit G [Streptomyces canus]
MEHEVFVPVPAERLREALADPVRFARAVPGLQQDAGAEPVSGRLKVRVGGHTITYRGSARLSAQDDGSYVVEGDATEARGTGVVKLALTLRVDEADGGSRLTFVGTASADGRIKELPADAVTSAVTRLLNRFAEHLGSTAEPKRGTQPARTTDTAEPPATEAPEPRTAKGTESPAAESAEPPAAEGTDVPDSADAGPSATQDADTTEPAAPLAPEATEDSAPSATGDAEAGPDADGTPVPTDEPTTPETPPTPDALDEPAPVPGEPEPATPVGFTPDLPAEAAHARRTMIGRSAEEVDHAPPRGRYAPVPAPHTGAPHSALRWAAPAAALVVASAIVVSRVLRKRH